MTNAEINASVAAKWREDIAYAQRLLDNPDFRRFMQDTVMLEMETQEGTLRDMKSSAEDLVRARDLWNALNKVAKYLPEKRDTGRKVLAAMP